AVLLPAPLFPQIIVGGVDRQAIQPRFKDLCRPQLIEGKIEPQKDFLGHILDILRTGNQPANSPQYALPVGQYDLIKRRAIILLRAPDKIEINQHAAPLGPASESPTGSVWIGVPASRQVTKLCWQTQNASQCNCSGTPWLEGAYRIPTGGG